jgi:hypothetical protein
MIKYRFLKKFFFNLKGGFFMRLGKKEPKELADLGGTFQEEPIRPGSGLFLPGNTWNPCEVPIVEDGGVYEDSFRPETSAILDGSVEHLCAGPNGEAMELHVDFLPDLEQTEESAEEICACEDEMASEDLIRYQDFDGQPEDDEPVVRVNGKSLADYLDPAKRVSTGTVAREERLSKEKTNVFTQERGLWNLNKRNRGQKPYHYWIEHRRMPKKPAALSI